jgi:hypothetical protein
MTQYAGLKKYDYREDGSIITVNSNEKFPSQFHNLGEWVSSIGIELPRPYTPVCYGGSYAVQVSRIQQVPLPIRKRLEDSLSRADNIEEGHFAERTWAALFMPPLNDKEIQLLANKGKFVNWHVNVDGAGQLGMLMEEDLFGPPKPVAPIHDKNASQWVQRDGQWQWPEIYRARVVGSNNVCTRPTVEPLIPKSTSSLTKAPTVAMCTMVEKDDLRYMNEWIDFHVVEGFAYFYLYDNSDTPKLEAYLNATRPGWSKFVTVLHWPGKDQQNVVWTDCFTDKVRQSNHTWAANFDVDEFLVLRQHEHVVAMLQDRCQNGSVHVESYTFAPDNATGEQREKLSQRLLNERETYAMSTKLSPYGITRPLLHRNQYSGEIGWDGTEMSKLLYRGKTVAVIEDVVSFQLQMPKLMKGKRRKTLEGYELDSPFSTPDISGHEVASLFRFPFKSVPEYVYKKCHTGSNMTSAAEREECESNRMFATTPGAWLSYRSVRHKSAWGILKKRIPWYQHFDDVVEGVSCKRRDAYHLFGPQTPTRSRAAAVVV